MKFSEKLQKLRKEKKLSQEQLAEMLEISRQSVSKWESGQTYPEMDKLIQLCRIFDCTLDDLTNDEVSDVSIQEKQKSQVVTIIDELLSAIDKTYTLFTHMNGKQIGRCLGELLVLAIILCICKLPFNYLADSIVNFFVNSMGDGSIGHLFKILLDVIHFSLALIIFFYLYDRQYLSKVDEYVENYEKQKGNPQVNETVYETSGINSEQEESSDASTADESEAKQEDCEETKTEDSSAKKKLFFFNQQPKLVKKEKTIKERKKRDFSGFKAFIHLCSSFCLVMIKFVVAFFSVPFLFSIVLFSAGLILAIYLGVRGVILFGVILGIIALMVLNYELLEFAYCFIFNKVYAWKRLFYMFIVSLITGGIALGLCVIDIAQFTFVDGTSPHVETQTDRYEYTMSDEFVLDHNSDYYLNDTLYIVDETMGDKIVVEVTYMKDLDKIEPIRHDDFVALHHTGAEVISIPKMTNIIINDMKDRTFYNYDTIYYSSIKIKATQKNLDKLQQNYDNFIEEQIAYDQEMNRRQQEIDELRNEYETQIREYEDRILEIENNTENDRMGLEEDLQLLQEENEQLRQQITEYEDRLNQLSELINN